MPQHYVDTLVKFILQTELKTLLALAPDTSNNSMSQIVDAHDNQQPQ